MKDKFPEMENFICITQLSPSVYGQINIDSLIGRNNGTKAVRMHRRMEYVAAYSPIRDHFYAGMCSVYYKILELLENKDINNGDLKRYWVVGVETGNDIPRRVLSFDMHVLQAESQEELYKSERFMSIPGIDDKKLHSVVYPYGRHYQYDMDSIDIENTIFHMRAYRYTPTPLTAFDLDQFTLDMESKECINFVNASFAGTNRELIIVGLKTENNEPTKVLAPKVVTDSDEIDESEIIRDPAGLATKKSNIISEDKKMMELETMNLDEVMGGKGTIHKEIKTNNESNENSDVVEVVESD